MQDRKRSVFKAAAVVAGNGIGSGVMAIPYYISHTGIAGGVTAFAAAYLVSVLMHLMIAEMVLHTGDTADILAVFNKYLFKGRKGKILRPAFFALLTIVLIANLSAYISGASEIFTGLLPVSPVIVKVVFFIFAASVVLAGLGAVCTGEAVSVSFMVVILVFMCIFSLLHINSGVEIRILGSITGWMAAYGMIMFSFSAIFAVPQVVEYLGGFPDDVPDGPAGKGEETADAGRKEKTEDADKKEEITDKGNGEAEIRKAIWLGLFINLVISVTVTVCTVITSVEVTDIAIVGWAESVGGTIRILGSVFIVFAMITSFWSIGLASADIVAGQTGLKRGLSFVIATVPALILTLTTDSSFTDYLKLVGGIVAMIISLMAVPSFLICMNDQTPVRIMRKDMKIKAVAGSVFVMYVIMAVGSCLNV